jgi:hypothetical protein
MHNAMIKGDTQTMEILLDKGSVKLDGLVGFGNIVFRGAHTHLFDRNPSQEFEVAEHLAGA